MAELPCWLTGTRRAALTRRSSRVMMVSIVTSWLWSTTPGSGTLTGASPWSFTSTQPWPAAIGWWVLPQQTLTCQTLLNRWINSIDFIRTIFSSTISDFSSFSLHLLHGYEFYHVIHHLFLSISITMCVNELIELSKSIFEINTIDSSEWFWRTCTHILF